MACDYIPEIRKVNISRSLPHLCLKAKCEIEQATYAIPRHFTLVDGRCRPWGAKSTEQRPMIIVTAVCPAGNPAVPVENVRFVLQQRSKRRRRMVSVAGSASSRCSIAGDRLRVKLTSILTTKHIRWYTEQSGVRWHCEVSSHVPAGHTGREQAKTARNALLFLFFKASYSSFHARPHERCGAHV